VKAGSSRGGIYAHQGEAGWTTRSNPSVPPTLLTIPATSAGERGALEEGVWGRNLVKVSPPLAQPPKTLPLKKRHAIKRMNAISHGRHSAAAIPATFARNAAAERCTAVSPHLMRRPWWQRVVAVVMGLNQNSHGFQQCRFLWGQTVLAFVHQLLHCGYHSVIFLFGLDSLEHDAIGQANVFLAVQS
jgi:hypothetical protein